MRRGVRFVFGGRPGADVAGVTLWHIEVIRRVPASYTPRVERHVKERLVGAAVLMAAAIILIPEMLSGPDRGDAEQSASARDGAVKTYTIDLNHPPGSPPQQQEVVKEAAPPPETAQQETLPAPIPAPTSEADPEPARDPESGRTASVPVPRGEEMPSVSEQPPASSPAASRAPAPTAGQSTPPPLVSQAAVPTSRGWAIQLGSFSSSATAERLAADFRSNRYDAFVMPVKSGSTTLYRVRIGPMKDKAAAEEALRTVRSKVAGAAVVVHP
jgi:DedD protein